MGKKKRLFIESKRINWYVRSNRKTSCEPTIQQYKKFTYPLTYSWAGKTKAIIIKTKAIKLKQSIQLQTKNIFT